MNPRPKEGCLGQPASLTAPRSTKPHTPGFHNSTNQTQTHAEHSVANLRRNSRGCPRRRQDHAHRRCLPCEGFLNPLCSVGHEPGNAQVKSTNAAPPPYKTKQSKNNRTYPKDFQTPRQKWCLSDGFQMEGAFSKSSPCRNALSDGQQNI